MNTLSTIAQRRAKEQADRITGADLEAAERDLWAPKRIAGTRVRVSLALRVFGPERATAEAGFREYLGTFHCQECLGTPTTNHDSDCPLAPPASPRPAESPPAETKEPAPREDSHDA